MSIDMLPAAATPAMAELHSRIQSQLAVVEAKQDDFNRSRLTLRRLHRELQDAIRAEDLKLGLGASIEPDDGLLTEMEAKIVRRYAYTQLSCREIGKIYHISVNTVKTHLRKAYRKLGVGTRGELSRRVRELGI